MKKLLFQFDTDIHPSVFDTVVAYDGGADHVIGHGGLTPETVRMLVEGAIFTRPPKEKKNTAIFIGGSNLRQGQALFEAVQKQFFAGFRVSLMFDSNGCNTTAAAAVAKLTKNHSLLGKKAVVLAGTGPVGQRAAVMLAKEGAHVLITSRSFADAESLCNDLKTKFNVNIGPIEAKDNIARAEAVSDANIVLSAGAAGIQLLKEEHWRGNSAIELIVDANASPPFGIGGIDMMDKGITLHDKVVWGALGFGSLKLALHRACITKLFETNTQLFDAENIYALAKEMA